MPIGQFLPSSRKLQVKLSSNSSPAPELPLLDLALDHAVGAKERYLITQLEEKLKTLREHTPEET